MSEQQLQNEIHYNQSVKIITHLLEKGLISPEEYHKIDCLNRKSFSPQLAELMP